MHTLQTLTLLNLVATATSSCPSFRVIPPMLFRPSISIKWHLPRGASVLQPGFQMYCSQVVRSSHPNRIFTCCNPSSVHPNQPLQTSSHALQQRAIRRLLQFTHQRFIVFGTAPRLLHPAAGTLFRVEGVVLAEAVVKESFDGS